MKNGRETEHRMSMRGVLIGCALPVEPAQSTAVSIRIDTTNVTGGMKTTGSQIMGCHTDLGYSNQIRGFYSQRVFGESFENKFLTLQPLFTVTDWVQLPHFWLI